MQKGRYHVLLSTLNPLFTVCSRLFSCLIDSIYQMLEGIMINTKFDYNILYHGVATYRKQTFVLLQIVAMVTLTPTGHFPS